MSFKSQLDGTLDNIEDVQSFYKDDKIIIDFNNINVTTRNILILLNQLLNTKFLILDTETTGLNTKKDIAFQFSYILTDYDLNIIESSNNYIDISKYGYILENYLMNLQEIKFESYENIFNNLLNNIDENTVIVGHNIRFDIDILKNCGLNLSNYRRYCTLNNTRKYFSNLPNNKLTTIAESLNLPTHNAHDALFDCEMCLGILKYLRGYFYI